MPLYHHENGDYGRVIDRNTGKEIKYCLWCNTDTGEYEELATDDKGAILYHEGNTIVKKGKGNLVFIRFGNNSENSD